MRIRFWGTRGSIARSGDRILRYGGNTACVEVGAANGACIVLDCGTGAVDLGATLCREGRAGRGMMLISHTHWDHIQGIPFFAPFFMPGAEWDIYAPRGLAESIRQTLAGQMQHPYFPISLDAFAADIRYHDIVEGAFRYQGVECSAHYLDHPALTLGYRLEADGRSVVYATDHEPCTRTARPGLRELHGAERSHVDFLRGADLVIHDAQFTAEEYPSKIGWGHSTPEYAVAVCLEAGVKRLAFTHHDPARSDSGVDAILEKARGQLRDAGAELDLVAASEGATIELGVAEPRTQGPAREQAAILPISSALGDHRIVACGLPPAVGETLRAAAEAERIPERTEPLAKMIDALGDRWATMLLGGDLAAEAADEISSAIREARAQGVEPARLIVVSVDGADTQDLPAERIVWPCTVDYLRARLRAAILRTECRWRQAPKPQGERERLQDLHALRILDTEPEERFDRITRVAARALRAPAALISLIDADRQWFKSCVGLSTRETTREAAFCAHAILEPDPLIVPDTLEDPRFAENPMVTGGLRVRFYAGVPIRSHRGLPLGTLCIIDTRPREIDHEQIALLEDLATLVEEQIESPRPDGSAQAM